MSTIAPPPKPTNPVLVDSEGYIDQQIRRTRRSLKLLDLAAGTLTLLIGLLGFILVGALIDHWIVPGGLSDGGRRALFGLMLAGVAWYGWRQFVPLLKPINPVYAAQTIERNTPTLKNSLLNLLLFRSHRDYLSARVYHALEQQTAVKLSSSGVDGSLDRSALLRLGYVLLSVIAVCALYAVLSPKSLALSTVRVLNPLSDVAAPSRVQIQDVKPGKTSVARGERVDVSAEIHGLSADEPVRLRYSTADERTVDESIRMERPSPESRRFEASLPRGANAGVEQDLTYWIEAGDARTRKFKLTVFTRPTLIVQKVHYAYPPYTGLPTKETNHVGDIRGVEGTKVTIGALASQKIKNAYVDFDADGTSDLPMKIDGDRAMVAFTLALREDRRTPVHPKYALRFTAEDGRQNADPPVYSIEVTPDYVPEVSITEPQEREQVARLSDVIPIGVEARDPDYGLKSVTIVGKVDDAADPVPMLEMIDEPQTGRVTATKLFSPADAGLKPGDVLEYWAVALDTKTEPNKEESKPHHFLKIIGPDKPQQGNQQQRPKQGAQQPNDDQQGGENGESGSSGAGGGQGGESGESGGEGQQQSGAGGSSAEGKEGEAGQEGDQGQDGAGGSGGGSKSGDSKEKSDQPGENGGGSGGSEGEQSKNDASQDSSQGSGGGASGQKQQPENGQSPSEQGGESGESGGKDSGEAGGAGGKVSSEGDEDATALQRIMEQWNKNNQQQDGQGKPGDKQQGGEQQTGEAGPAGQSGESNGEQQGAEGAQQEEAQGGQQQPNQGNAAKQGSAQRQGERGQDAKEGEAGDDQQTDGEQGNQPSNGSPQSNTAGGQGKQGTGQQPQAEGAQPQGPGEQAGDQQQQGENAGANPSPREGADQAREARPGDGDQQQQEDQEQSPDSAMNQSGGDSGAGHNTGKEQGAPGGDDANRQGTKKNQEDNRPGREDNEAPAGSNDKKESDSQGGASGDQSGGGQDGGGQKADAPGKGGPGQHQAADEGAGRAQEQGEGETGAKAGEQQKAEGQTGQSSGDQSGNGSQQRETGESGEQQPGEQQPGEQENEQSGKPAESGQQGSQGQQPQGGQQGSSQGKPGEQGAEGSQGPQGDKQQPPAGNQQGGEQQPGSEAQGQQGDQGNQPGSDAAGGQSPQGSPPNDQSQGNQQNQQPNSNQNSAGSAPPMGGGTGSAANSSSSAESGELGADQANLDYAREQTNLVLEGLDQQLSKKQVDRELLKNLGWTEAELQRFIDRWKNLKERAAGEGEDAEDAKQELNETLGSLGLRKDGPLRFQGKAKADDLRANDALRVKPPSEYADRVREYTKGISSQRKD